MTSLSTVPLSDRTVTTALEASSIVTALLPSFIPPLTCTPVPGGITNTIYRVRAPSSPSPAAALGVLVRVFGAEGVISAAARAEENAVYAELAAAGLAPGLKGVFANGRVEAWLDSRPLDLDEMRDDDVIRGVAEKMARLHRFRPPVCGGVGVWEAMQGWEAGEGAEAMAKEVGWLKEVLAERFPSPIVFTHGDLLMGNILLSMDGERRVDLIDFEYSGEAMGGTLDGHVDSSKYPSAQAQTLFCRTYLKQASDKQPSEADVAALVREANAYGLLAHLYWALWGLAQAKTSGVDFDYVLFAQERFRVYKGAKGGFLSVPPRN